MVIACPDNGAVQIEHTHCRPKVDRNAHRCKLFVGITRNQMSMEVRPSLPNKNGEGYSCTNSK